VAVLKIWSTLNDFDIKSSCFANQFDLVAEVLWNPLLTEFANHRFNSISLDFVEWHDKSLSIDDFEDAYMGFLQEPDLSNVLIE
jgi:hypothetical protein